MAATTIVETKETGAEIELATFYVGDLLLGADIQRVCEINRCFELTPVPHAPTSVRGAINLRGNVVTVLDLRIVLGLGQAEMNRQMCNVVVESRGEQIGLLVDRIADTLHVPVTSIQPPPANVHGVNASLFTGVHRLEKELLVVLDIDAVLTEAASRAATPL
jgi:purine-binding chemotaxis protein CheW